MKQILALCTIAGLAFAAGLASSWFVGQSVANRLDDQFDFVLTREPEYRIRTASYTLDLLRAGNTAKAIEINCRMLQSSLPSLNMAKPVGPQRDQSTRRLLEHAQSTVNYLEGSNSCGM